ncbi:MAG: type I restriction enzyme HsdR N-terminal domain-containing protein [Paludibacteraceae bacterium]|nr:type I restriction enzyme HsdR N-terminal domain-containing protein [Paludibacteraceae bacterium]
MSYAPNIRRTANGDEIFCRWRMKFVRLTPEEWVRQTILHALVEQYAYPPSRIAVEYSIEVADLKKRCDAVIFDGRLRPVCIVEFKREEVALTQKVQDQVAVYNRKLKVNYFIISNGRQMLAAKLTETGYEYLQQVPSYELLCQKN